MRKPWSKANLMKVPMADWPEMEVRFGERLYAINGAVRGYSRKTRSFIVHRLAGMPDDLADELAAWMKARYPPATRKRTNSNGASS